MGLILESHPGLQHVSFSMRVEVTHSHSFVMCGKVACRQSCVRMTAVVSD